MNKKNYRLGNKYNHVRKVTSNSLKKEQGI